MLRHITIFLLLTSIIKLGQCLKLVCKNEYVGFEVKKNVWFENITSNSTCNYKVLLVEETKGGYIMDRCVDENGKFPCKGNCLTAKLSLPYRHYFKKVFVIVDFNGKRRSYKLDHDTTRLKFLPFFNGGKTSLSIFYPLVLKGGETARVSLHSHGSTLLNDYFENSSNDISYAASFMNIPMKNLYNGISYKLRFSKYHPLFYYYSNNYFHRSNYTGEISSIMLPKDSNSTAHTYSLINQSDDKSVMCSYKFIGEDGTVIDDACNGYSCINMCDDVESVVLPSNIEMGNFDVSIMSNDYGVEYKRRVLSNEHVILDTYTNYLGDFVVNLHKFERNITHISTSIRPTEFKSVGFKYSTIGNDLNRILLYGFNMSTRYRLETTFDKDPYSYEVEFTSDGIQHNYSITPGIDMINISPDNIIAPNDRIKTHLHNTRKRILCKVLVSTDPHYNFIPAYCNLRGDYCLKSCFSSFEVHHLRPHKNYYFKVVAAETFNTFKSDEPVSLTKKFKTNLAIVRISDHHSMMVFKPSSNMNNLIGLYCIVFITEPTENKDEYKYYRICNDQTFCVIPCRQIVWNPMKLPKHPQLFISIKIIHFTNDYMHVLLNSNLAEADVTKFMKKVDLKNAPNHLDINPNEFSTKKMSFKNYTRYIEKVKAVDHFENLHSFKKMLEEDEDLDVHHPMIYSSDSAMDKALWDIKMEVNDNKTHPLGVHRRNSDESNSDEASKDPTHDQDCTESDCKNAKNVVNIYYKVIDHTPLYDKVVHYYKVNFPDHYEFPPDLKRYFIDNNIGPHRTDTEENDHESDSSVKAYKEASLGLIISVVVFLLLLIIPISVYFTKRRKRFKRHLLGSRTDSHLDIISKCVLTNL